MHEETTFSFVLPHGYVDPRGKLHKQGAMRRATGKDELVPSRDRRVRGNPAYLPVLVLSGVLVRLGDLDEAAITPEVIERLHAADFAFLRDFYRKVNGIPEAQRRAVKCPHCGREFPLE